MSLRRRDLVALVVVAFTFLLGASAWSAGPSPTGMHLVVQDDQLVVGSVDIGSSAALIGVKPGMVVIRLDEIDVIAASPATKAAVAASTRSWQWMQALWPDQIPAELAAREQVAREQGAAASASPVDGITDGLPVGADVYFPDYVTVGLYWPDDDRPGSGLALFTGLLILFGGVWWLGTGRAGASLQRLAITLPVATAMPLFALPIQLLPVLPFLIVSVLVVPLGMFPLAADFSEHLGNPAVTRRLRVAMAVVAAASVLVGMAFIVGAPFELFAIWSAVFAGCIVFIPGLLAARPTFRQNALDASRSAPAPGSFVESTELVLAAATPAVALSALALKSTTPFLGPLLLWLVAILLARRFTLRPLLRLATRATFQRDVVVAATEAERARIAADIHDDALQDLTMLVRRLDSSGDKENAEAAREIAVRLRAICGELRLPILDDLGLGPALDWLTERFEPIARGPVYLERNRDEQRPPANVELALFRIAQEALNNAVKHGAPHIVVRYRAGGTWAELDVDDAGPGLAPGAAELAEQTGHLGLLTMTQRSEAVGAELRIGRRPGGGTRVSVVWEANASTAHVAKGASGAAATATALPQP